MREYEYVNEGPVCLHSLANADGVSWAEKWGDLFVGMVYAPRAVKRLDDSVVYIEKENKELTDEEREQVCASSLFQTLAAAMMNLHPPPPPTKEYDNESS